MPGRRDVAQVARKSVADARLFDRDVGAGLVATRDGVVAQAALLVAGGEGVVAVSVTANRLAVKSMEENDNMSR